MKNILFIGTLPKRQKIRLAGIVLYFLSIGIAFVTTTLKFDFKIQLVGLTILFVFGEIAVFMLWYVDRTSILNFFIIAVFWSIMFSMSYESYIFSIGNEFQTVIYSEPLRSHQLIRYVTKSQSETIFDSYVILAFSAVSYYLGKLILKIGDKLRSLFHQ